MGKKKESNVTVTVYGIAYPEFAKLKWQQFLRGFSLAVALLVRMRVFVKPDPQKMWVHRATENNQAK